MQLAATTCWQGFDVLAQGCASEESACRLVPIPGIGNVLVFADSASGWIEASLKPSRTTDVVVSALGDWCSRFGVPKVFVTDNAPEFVSAELNR